MPRKKPSIPAEAGKKYVCQADGTEWSSPQALATHEAALAKKAAAAAAGKAPTKKVSQRKKVPANPAAEPIAPIDALSRLKALKTDAPQMIKELETKIKFHHGEAAQASTALAQMRAFVTPATDPALMTHAAGSGGQTQAAGS